MQTSAQIKNEEKVIEFLKKNPSFLLNHTELLETLVIPHFASEDKQISSLIEYQVSALRNKNQNITKQLREFIAVAQNNEVLWKKTQKMILNLIKQKHLKSLIETAYESAKECFSMESFSLILFSTNTVLDEKNYCRILDQTHVENSLKMKIPSKTLCDTFRKDIFHFLFGSGEKTESALISPLFTKNKRVIGVFSLGHSYADHFHADLDTSFIDFLLQVLSEQITRLLPDNFNSANLYSIQTK